MLKPKPLILLGAVFAAVLYNIWPLAYILDPQALNNSYFSLLEVPGRPYAWLFILGDILTGILVTALGIMAWKTKTLNKHVSIGYLIFGLSTFFDAVFPISKGCETTITDCGVGISQILTLHFITSLCAALGVFYALVMTLRLIKATKGSKSQYKLLSSILYGWCLSGLFLLTSIFMHRFTTFSQALFLAACSLVFIVIPAILFQLKTESTKSL